MLLGAAEREERKKRRDGGIVRWIRGDQKSNRSDVAAASIAVGETSSTGIDFGSASGAR